MDAFVIEGGRPLKGEITISGSKNAALPLMAAGLLTEGELVLSDVPDLRDIQNMMGLLEELGCSVVRDRSAVENSENEGTVDVGGTGGARGVAGGGAGVMRIRTITTKPSHARYEIVRTMRASICALGPLVARRGYARISMPGGCAIGERPVDLHLRGLRALGAEIKLEAGDIVATAKRLVGTTIFLGGPFGSTVLGTANIMSAATLAHGTTVIESAACEPEILELANLLNAMGAEVRGAGTPRITIEGVETLQGASHTVMPDRIEAGTYLIAAAMTKSDLTLRNCPADCLLALQDRLHTAGIALEIENNSTDPQRAAVQIRLGSQAKPRISALQVTTQPYPGFPTDLQAQLMALLCLADGISVVTEKIYPERFLHVAELSRMGARIYRQGPTAVVQGVKQLVGAPVMASDLRASAGLVLAGLMAEGTTTVNRVYHLDRGYAEMESKLNAVGANILRVDDADL